MANAPQQPFTRLPVSDLASARAAVSDIYDKLNVIAQSQAQPVATLPSRVVAATKPVLIRTVNSSTFVTVEDHTVVAVITQPAVFTLPDARPIQGKTLHVKNAAQSTAILTLGTYVQTQSIDQAAPTTYALNPAQGVEVQSDGQNWILLSQL